ncbi:MAG: glutamine--fructose-6-phosphate transaminase (isomerizing) [Roseibium album]|uniref:glutamine--fructose-6-phosphate transaminase (isomerizing) n=1 Tax=Roseibium album TaxID=311410 RepID=UPI0032EB3D31
MCGVVGYVGRNQAVPILVEGLHRLEYRGYDSAGIAVHRAGKLAVFKAQGRVRDMEARLPARVKAHIGIGHTRWATHGAPSDINAHPHLDGAGRIAVIHNGIVENARPLRERLARQGAEFVSETDTELLAHLIAQKCEETNGATDGLVEAVRRALLEVQGAYGIAVLDRERPDELVVARRGSPMVLGIGEKEMFAASDVAALVRHTQRVVYLDDGEIAHLTADGYRVTTLEAGVADKTPALVDAALEDHDKEHFEHFTIKEIHEQPDVIERVLRGRIDDRFATARLDGLNLSPRDLLGVRRIKILGCGSAYLSGRLGAGIVEHLARIPCDAEPAAEFRYRNPIIEPDTLYFAVSQSGETYDTLAAVEEIKRKGGRVLGVVNSVGSSIARSCGSGAYLHAGAEVAVVSTKTFVATVVIFALVGLLFGRTRDLSHADGERLIRELRALSGGVSQLIEREDEFKRVGEALAQYENAYFIGRGAGYSLALEGALKLKEISYIHAEGYPASELKHGPLALISPTTPTLALVPDDDQLAKNLGSIEEIRARGGPVFAVTQVTDLPIPDDHRMVVPATHELLAPLLMLVPLQFIAYFASLARGCDVDRPRNLAKSVTVE